MFNVRLICSALALISAAASAGALTISQFNTPLSENFDSLAVTGPASVTPPGWSFAEVGSGANTTYAAGAGTSATGDTYSFGAAGSGERAFGTLQTGSVSSVLTLGLTNGTGVTLGRLAIAYTGEQWRLGSTGRNDRLDFAYSLDGLNWVEVDALDFVAPNASGTAGALDGNAAANRVDLNATLSGLNISHGQSFWLRWVDFGAAGADDGLGVDNFSLTAIQPLTPPVGGNVPDSLPAHWIAGAFGLVLWLGRSGGRARVGLGRRALPGTISR